MSEPSDRRGLKAIFRGLTLVGSLALSAFLIWKDREDLRDLRNVSFGIALAMIGLQAAYLVTQSEKLRWILREHAEKDVPPLEWTRIFLIGRLFNGLLMQSGNAYRLVALKQRYEINYSRYVSSLAAQTWTSVLLSLVIAVMLLAMAPGHSEIAPGILGSLILLTVLVGIGPTLARTVTRSRWIRRRGGRPWRALRGAIERVAATLTSRSLAIPIIVTTLLGFVVGVFNISLAFNAAGHAVPLYASATLLALMQITNLVMLTPGNLGIQELGYAAIISFLGVPAATGIVASAIVRVTGMIALAISTVLVDFAVRSTGNRAER